LGEEYITLILSLGLEYSPQKTYKSPVFFEFAKRVFYKKEEISPFPVSALKESLSRYHSLVNLMIETETKGWVTDDIPAGVAKCYGMILHKPRIFRRKMKEKSVTHELIMRMIKDPDSASKYISNLSRSFGHLEYQISDEGCKLFLSFVIRDLFMSTDPVLDSPKSKRDLGTTAVRLVEDMTNPKYWGSEDLAYSLGFSLIQSIPQLNVYGKVEARYTDFRKGLELDCNKTLTE
jgi:hypothetical protein